MRRLRPTKAIASVIKFYVDGFKGMTVGRKLWTLIIIKLVILFGIFKLFFFPDVLSERFDNDASRADAVRTSLTSTPPSLHNH